MKIEINFNDSGIVELKNIDKNVIKTKNLVEASERVLTGSEIMELIGFGIEDDIESIEVTNINEYKTIDNKNNPIDAFCEIVSIFEKIANGINEYIESKQLNENE
jgi:hypothetical protein